MKITAHDTFHRGQLSVSFAGCTEGVNIRRLRGPRSRYCLDYNCNNTHVCGCGYPATGTNWTLPDGWVVADARECGVDGDLYGRGYLRIDIRQDYNYYKTT